MNPLALICEKEEEEIIETRNHSEESNNSMLYQDKLNFLGVTPHTHYPHPQIERFYHKYTFEWKYNCRSLEWKK